LRKVKFLGTTDPLAQLAFLVLCIVWGSTYLVIKVGVNELPPALFAGVRFTAVGIILLVYARLKGIKMPDSWEDIKVSAIVGLFLLTGGAGLVVWSEQHITSGLAALLIATEPIFIALLERFLPGGKSISKLGWTGLILGFLGVGLLVAPDLGLGRTYVLGLLGVLAASFSWSLGSVYSVRRPVASPTVVNIAIQSLAGGSVLVLIGLLTGEAARFHLTPTGIWALIYLTGAGSLLAYSAYIYLIKVIPPYKAATYSYVNPVVAVLLGFLILDEPITKATIIGATIILSGIVLVQSSKIRDLPQGDLKESQSI